MRFPRQRGSTSVKVRIFIPNNSLTTGAGLAGLLYNSTNLAIAFSRELQNGFTQITGANIVTITTIGTWASPGTGKLGFKAVDATNFPGLYEIHFPDDAAAFGTGDVSQHVILNVLELTTTALKVGPCGCLIPLVPWDYQDGVRMGLTALPNAAAEAAGGLYTRGTGAGQIAQDANGRISGNLVAILGTTLTETAGYLAGTFKKFFNVATPTGTVNSLPDAVAGQNNGLALKGSPMLVTPGTGTGQLDVTSGVLKADFRKILGGGLTEAAPGALAVGFTHFFNVATPTGGTINSLPSGVVATAPEIWSYYPRTLTSCGAQQADIWASLLEDGINYVLRFNRAGTPATGLSPIFEVCRKVSNGAEVVLSQYAVSVIAVSSENTSVGNPYYPMGAAIQALGPPDTFAYVDSSNAWAPLSNFGTNEFISLGFSTPVYATGIVIRENSSSPFVQKVELRDSDGAWHTVWESSDPSEPGTLADFLVPFTQTAYLVDGVRISFYTGDDESANWKEIDAVKLIGTVAHSITEVSPITEVGEGFYKFTADITEPMVIRINGGGALLIADQYKEFQIDPHDADLDARVSTRASEDGIQAHAAAALNAYDPPTRDEAIADEQAILAAITALQTVLVGLQVRVLAQNQPFRVVLDGSNSTRIEYKQGEERPLVLAVEDALGNAVDLSGATLLLGVKRDKSQADYTFNKLDAVFNKTQAAQGIVSVPITSADTNQPAATYVMELKCAWTGPLVQKSADMSLQIERAITA